MTMIKNISELKKGHRFMAGIADIRPDTVVIELEGGVKLTARSLILPDARIGERAVFVVKDNDNGQIRLEMVKGDAPDSEDGENKRRAFDMRI